MAPDNPNATAGPYAVRYEIIDERHAGQRIDNFLIKVCKGVPSSHLYKIVRAGAVRVNKKRIDNQYRLQLGDSVRIPPLRLALPTQASVPLKEMTQAAAIETVFEDEALWIIDKPAGIAVHGGSGISFGVIELLRQRAPELRFLELAHRLDRETSGLLVLAKKRSALNGIQDAWRQGQVHKRYQALVAGLWSEAHKDIQLPLFKFIDAKGERRVRVDAAKGQHARSVCRVLARYPAPSSNDWPCVGFSLLQVQLKTGRTHQIRVHLAAQETPIVGDERYGDFELNRVMQKATTQPAPLRRMFLHASELAFVHPLTQQPLRFTAPLPPACQAFITALESAILTPTTAR